ncbi:sensor histidine kinase [Halalkalibacter okhensis]|uniref:histidine kinase n=1 Tax=Halalkalibacter okhensis TaxID=333138 RepID=A0A0B0IA22_9BACI|nr:sensor histidine kinase [Halalkalibacter okhensis]KHF39353.1 hypothetical protein LQ50_15805 [Halalkalibacter okhensis]
MKSKVRLMVLLLLTFFLLFLALIFKHNEAIEDVVVRQGVAQLDAIQKDQIYNVTGDWEFHWKELLEPDDFLMTALNPIYLKTPRSWVDTIKEHENNSIGYGTYRLQLVYPEDLMGEKQAFYLGYIGVAYKVWVDGVLLDEVGEVSSNKEGEIPLLKSNFIYFEPDQEQVEVIIQVSNHEFREGGIFGDVLTGSRTAITNYIVKNLAIDLLLIGGFLFIGIYHLVMFGVSKNDITFFYIGMIGLLAALRNMLLCEYLFYLLFPTVPWTLMTRVEYLCEVVGLFFLVSLMYKMYPKEVNKHVLNLAYAMIGILVLYYLFAPMYIYTSTLTVSMIPLGLILFYFIFVVGLKALAEGREGAKLNVFGIILLTFASINDILSYTQSLQTIPMLGYSTLFFLMLQGIIKSDRYTKLYEENRELTQTLVKSNATLESKVIERTEKLGQTNKRLEELNNSRAEMLAFIAHDLGSPIIAIKTQLSLMKEGYVAPNEQLYEQMIQKSDYMKRLVQDLFELSKLESKEYVMLKKNVNVKKFMEDVWKVFSHELNNQQFMLSFTNMVGAQYDSIYIEADQQRLMQVLSNFIFNAVKYSKNVNKVELRVMTKYKGSKGYVQVEVEDYGVGIEAENIPFVFNRFYREQPHQKDGTGLGLTIAKEIIHKHGGVVGVTSIKGKGSTFYFTLPMKEEK